MSFASENKDKELFDLKRQIDTCMRKAMDELLEDTMSQKMDASQVEWIIRLLEETINRLNNLTPSRKDLHSELKGRVDLDLISQMMIHEAIEENDVTFLVNTFYDRIQMLCAPSQDSSIEKEKKICLEQKSISGKICFLLSKTNKNIDDIQELLKRFNNSQ